MPCSQVGGSENPILKRQETISLTSSSSSPSAETQRLKIFSEGESLRINNLTGEGIPELRLVLCSVAESLESYGEVIPAAYVKLRLRLREMHQKDSCSWRRHWRVKIFRR